MRRLPRQITLRMLLFVVAVVALNCGAYRLLYQAGVSAQRDGSPSPETLNCVIGALPLINVAMIGSALFLASRVRVFRRGRESSPRTGPAAVTYFSLVFLALGFEHATLMPVPGLVNAFLEPLTPAADYDWKAILDSDPANISRFVFKCLFFGVLISGPPLRQNIKQCGSRFRKLSARTFNSSTVVLNRSGSPRGKRPRVDSQTSLGPISRVG